MTDRLEFLIATAVAAMFTLVWLVIDGQLENASGFARLFAGVFLLYAFATFLGMHQELANRMAAGIRSLIGQNEVDP